MAIGSKTLGPDQLDALDDDALAAELAKSKEELFNLRFQSRDRAAGEPRTPEGRAPRHRKDLHDPA